MILCKPYRDVQLNDGTGQEQTGILQSQGVHRHSGNVNELMGYSGDLIPTHC